MKNLTEQLSAFVANVSFSDLDEQTVEQTRLYIADYLAAAYAGYRINADFNKAVREVIVPINGAAEADVLITGERISAEHAAFLNAVYVHGADMDDGNRKARGHIAAHVMSAVFALGQTQAVTWKDLVVAINVGYEVFNRIGAAIQPDLVHRGFHSTGTAGAIACSAACAKLSGLDRDGIYNAIGIGAIQASGLMLIAESGQACKPLNPANAAKTGILSARLAGKGIIGPHNPLESSKGWFHAMGDHVAELQVTEGLGTVFTINESYLKPYPSCRHTHCGIEAAARLRERLREENRLVSQIRQIRVYTYADAIQIAGQIRFPRSAEDAKFSIHYSLATALLTGDFTLNDLTDRNREDCRQLIEITELVREDSLEQTDAGIRGARVELFFAEGGPLSETVLLPKGDAANPFFWPDMERKMQSCMKGLLHDRQILETAERIRTLDLDKPYGSVLELIGES